MTAAPRKPTAAEGMDATVVGAADAGGATVVGGEAAAGPGTTHANLGATDVRPAGGGLGATMPEEPSAGGGDAPLKQLGDFKIIRLLGKGGMGEVYLAHQISLDRDVALKVMAKQFCTNEMFAKRFIREAQTMAKLDHPHVVRGYAVGEDPTTKQLYLAMELIKGKSMQDWMKELGKLSIGDALHVILKTADALQHAHDQKMIHRDIKPDNILVTDKGVVKVSDLGLAKATDDDMSMTQSGTGLGTPYYMPPEQAANAKHVDQRSDIYALGCTLYHFLTGKLPFAGSSAIELITNKQKGTFQRARSHNNSIPERLDLMIDKMIAKDPKSRYQSCTEVIRDLSGLNLHHVSLSFIPGAESQPAIAPGRAPTAPAASTPAGGGAAPPAKSSAAGTTSGGIPKQALKDDAVWYVQLTGSDGNPKKAKATTAQIKQMLLGGKLDAKALVCTEAKGKYIPITSVKDFLLTLEERVSRAKADKKAETFSQLYKDIDKDQYWYKWKKFFRGYVDAFKGFVSLTLYLGVLIAIGFAAWYFWPTIMGMIQSRTGG